MASTPLDIQARVMRVRILASKSNVRHADGRGRRFPYAGAIATLRLGGETLGERGGLFREGSITIRKPNRETRRGRVKVYVKWMQLVENGWTPEFRADVCGERGKFLGNAKLILPNT